ncbi:unnamed protein product [Phytomonas sp. Hart1]|nr:unnamed protein product [Phytomonas sp. Hart1]|eukprot:CCW69744.1 unnamed protein product [Phytomonas sp. isolate Hart1]
MDSNEKEELDSPSVSYSSTYEDVVKERHYTRFISTRTRTKTPDRNQVSDFDHRTTTTSITNVYDELVAYDRQEDNPYWGYVERVERYVARTSLTNSSDPSSDPHRERYDESQGEIGNSMESSTMDNEWDHRDEYKEKAPYRRRPPSLTHTDSSSSTWESTKRTMNTGGEVDIRGDDHHTGSVATHHHISVSENLPHSKEGNHHDRTVGAASPEDVEFQTEAAHAVTERIGKGSPINDFDEELLEIVKAYYECRQINFPAAAQVGYRRRGADFNNRYSPTDVPLRGVLQGGAIPLSTPAPIEEINPMFLDLSSSTRSTSLYPTTQFLQTQPLDTTLLSARSELFANNGPKAASMGNGTNLFHRSLAVSKKQSKPFIATPASPTGGVLRYRRGPGRVSKDGSTERAFLTSFPSSSPTSFVRAYVLDMNINLEPAIAVTGLAALLNIIVVYFLQNHVLDTRDHLGLFLVGSYLTFSSYYMAYYFLENYSSSFRRISSTKKKFYIIGNLIKAGILISITPFAVYQLSRIVLYDEWESNILRNLGCIFALPDFISMIIVERMRWSTWIHHLCVVLFNYFSIMNDYKKENIFRCIVVYAGFSSFGYCVNVLLASRFLGLTPSVARILSFMALVVYGLCCSINWSWQVYYLLRLIRKGNDLWSVYLYLVLICFVVWDDIILNIWLLNHAKNMAYAASKR